MAVTAIGISPLGECAAPPQHAPLLVDLDADGKPERIETRLSGADSAGTYYHLAVVAPDGKVIWSGPKNPLDRSNPVGFGEWHHGNSMPEMAADIDADGAIELVARAAQSDVSPTSFRVLRWKDNQFKPVQTSQLLESPKGSGQFPWKATSDSEGCWISGLHSTEKPNVFAADITEFRGGADARQGRALVEPIAGGFKVQSWIEPIKRAEGQGQSKATSTPAVVERPEEETLDFVASYTAQIAPEDLRNTNGVLLTQAFTILLQDRANYHTFNIRQPGDQADETYFITPERRLLFNQLPVKITPKAEAGILRGDIIVTVTAYSDRIDVRAKDE